MPTFVVTVKEMSELSLEVRARKIVDEIVNVWEHGKLGPERAEKLLSAVLDAFPELNDEKSYPYRMWNLADEALCWRDGPALRDEE
jgi:hypothetical protein